MRFAALATFGLITASAALAADRPVLDPPGMIALADSDPHRSHEGTYRMTVRAAQRTPYVTYLNSNEDYRSPGDVTFRLPPVVAHSLERRIGAPPETALLGKVVTVRGILMRTLIVNTVSGRGHDFNRWSYAVQVETAAQVLSITSPG